MSQISGRRRRARNPRAAVRDPARGGAPGAAGGECQRGAPGAQSQPPRSRAARHLDARYRRHIAAQGVGEQRPAHHAGGHDVGPRHHRHRRGGDPDRRLSRSWRSRSRCRSCSPRSARRCGNRRLRRNRLPCRSPTSAELRSSASSSSVWRRSKRSSCRCSSPVRRAAARACVRVFCTRPTRPGSRRKASTSWTIQATISSARRRRERCSCTK